MNNKAILTIVCAIAALTTAIAGQPETAAKEESLAGDWLVRFLVENQTVPGTMTFKLKGRNVTGTVDTAHTGPGTVEEGKWIDRKLTATLVFEKHESIALTGGLKTGDGQKLEGEFRTEGRVGKWEAERPSEKPSAASATP